MEIYGIKYEELELPIDEEVDIRRENPYISITKGRKKCDKGIPIEICIITNVNNISYSSTLFYAIRRGRKTNHVKCMFLTHLLSQSVNHHIEYIYKVTSKKLSFSFYKYTINKVASK